MQAVAESLDRHLRHAVHAAQGVGHLIRRPPHLHEDDRIGLQIGQFFRQTQVSAPQDDDALGDRLHLRKQVGRQHDGVGPAEVAQGGQRFLLLAGVEAVGRLVEDQQRRVGDQGVGQADALAEALGQRAEQGPANALQPAALDAVAEALGRAAAVPRP